MSSLLLRERIGADGEILVLTLNRPERRNAITQELAEELDRAMQFLETEPGMRVGILTGSGGFFSAGTDLSSTDGPATPDGGPYGFIRRSRTRPLIAAVEGFALGGGFEMAMACDLVVAAQDVKFSLPETLVGLVANCGALFRGPTQLTPKVATELLLTGQRLPAQRAYDLGFINRLSEPGESLNTALKLAHDILAASPNATTTTLKAISEAQRVTEEPLWELTAEADRQVHDSPESAEGIAAFFDKRPPEWGS